MSNRYLTAVLSHAPYPAGGKRCTLIALANGADDQGALTYVSRMRQIATHAGLTERQCRRVRRQLEKDKLLVEEAPRAGKTSLWRLTLPPEWFDEPAAQPAQPPPSPAVPDTEESTDPLADARRRVIEQGAANYARAARNHKSPPRRREAVSP